MHPVDSGAKNFEQLRRVVYSKTVSFEESGMNLRKI